MEVQKNKYDVVSLFKGISIFLVYLVQKLSLKKNCCDNI